MRALGHEDILTLEALVDSYGLSSVINGLAEIAGGKGDHIMTNWQDRPLAGKWFRKVAPLEKLAQRFTMENE